jgi:hypothetical protein
VEFGLDLVFLKFDFEKKKMMVVDFWVVSFGFWVLDLRKDPRFVFWVDVNGT